ncbi:GNAT family N-acetyltransferase [Candidatus Tisiphia endosymbiont of Nemotelus uliginosus]|uniref:GNAT family N-acetyltransferase n=1 Tax=Candidatus Tisiphia endosymbiont of Nemotelus uliginosus TaxID=3077926 RepID=UPI0035C932AF
MSKAANNKDSLSPIDAYLDKFSRPKLTYEDISDLPTGRIAYIDTDRFTARSLYSEKTTYDEYSTDIQQLYKVTFNDPIVMQKFATGNTKTQEQFESMVNLQSVRWAHGYPFAAFIITDNDKDHDVVGYEVIGNSENVHTGELAYLFNKAYHRSETIKDVGYENVGALCLEYGQTLFNEKRLVNQVYNQDNEKFTGGTVFTKLEATVRDDNPGSQKILEKIGGRHITNSYKFEHNRLVFEKLYDNGIVQLYDDSTMDVLGAIGGN